MAGEIRRSGRATKGQHTKNQEAEASPPKPKSKSRVQSTIPNSAEPDDDDENDDEEEAIIRCICGANEDEEGWMMISCEDCTAWQHNLCMGITEEEELLPETYYCEQCKPEDHKDLLAAIERGDKPWEERIVKRHEEEKAAKAKKGKKGKPKTPRTSTAAEPTESSDTPAKVTPARSVTAPIALEAGTKRKFDAVEVTNGSEKASSNAPSSTTPTVVSTEKRKSGGPEQHQKRTKSVSEAVVRRESLASAIQKVESIDQLPKERLPAAKTLGTELKGLIQKAVKDGSYKLRKGETHDALGVQLAIEIEHALFSRYNNITNPAYGEQFRAIKFNLKKNHALVKRILTGSLRPEELAEMSSDDMASEELQKERERIKEEADKQAVLIQESGPRYRKTHKGEELIGGDESMKQEEPVYTAPVRRLTQDQDMHNLSPIEAGSPPPSTELPEGYDRPARLTMDTSTTGASSKFNIQKVWKSVQSPDGSKAGGPNPARRQSTQQKPDVVMREVSDDPELNRLLKDEDTDMVGSPTPVDDPGAVWRGRVHMSNVGAFLAVARFAAGGDVGQKIPYHDLIPEALEIDGRIAVNRANEYVSGMRYSTSTDVCALALSPMDTKNDRKGFEQIFNYFREKERWGVVAQHKHQAVRDIYVVTVEAGMSPLPSFVAMLEQSQIEAIRPSNLLLLTLVVRTRNPTQAAAPLSAATLSNPVNQLQPQFSPLTAGSAQFSLTHNMPPAAPVPVSALAAQILGPYVAAPVVAQILGSVGDMSEVQLQNLRDILEREPSTRDDIAKLGMHLQDRQKEAGP